MHDAVGKKYNALTEVFFTPDRLKIQIYGKMINCAGNLYPEFRIVKIKESDDLVKA